MKLLLKFTMALIFAGMFFACGKKEETLPTPQSHCNTNPVRFDALEVGQTSCYIGLRGEDYNSGDPNNFVYSDDTLVVSIVGKDAVGYLVNETLAYTGDVFDWLKPEKDSVFHYHLVVSGDSVHFKPINSTFLFSRIFSYQIVMQGLPLAKFSNQGIAIEGWKTNVPYCECRQTGYAENYTLFGTDYPFLNILVENSDMALDGNGETYVYTKETGIVRAANYSWWSSNGIGWDLLPAQ